MWRSNFKLGRPGYGTLFQLNPTAIDYTPRKIGDLGRGLDGTGVNVTLSRNRPLIRINGNYITPDQFNQFTALMQVDDVPLVFEPVDYSGANVWESWSERVIPTSSTTIPIPANSFTRAAELQQLYGAKQVVRVFGLNALLRRDHDLSMPSLWNQRGNAGGLISPGIWGTIFKEDFNNLAVGLLSDAGPWIVSGGNGTTRDMFVTSTPSEVLEGARGLIFTTDGAATLLQAQWRNGGHLTTPGFIAEHNVATWKMQMVYTVTGSVAQVTSDPTVGLQAWKVKLEVTSGTTVDLVIERLSVEVYRAPLTGPFLEHEFGVLSEYRASEGGDRFLVTVDSGTVWDEAVYPGDTESWTWTGSTPGGGGASTLFRLDDFNAYDGDGYDPSTGLVNLVVSSPLSSLDPLWLTYKYNALAVNLSQVPYRSEGGWVDFYRYNFQLEGM